MKQLFTVLAMLGNIVNNLLMGTTRFVECENDRVTCTGTISTSCSDTDGCN